MNAHSQYPYRLATKEPQALSDVRSVVHLHISSYVPHTPKLSALFVSSPLQKVEAAVIN